MGSWDVFKYMDDFEDLVELAGFEDPLMKVTKFWTGLDLAINHAITLSSDPPRSLQLPGVAPACLLAVRVTALYSYGCKHLASPCSNGMCPASPGNPGPG